MKLLLKSKASIHIRNSQGLSAPDIARHFNHFDIVSLFLPNNPEEEIELGPVIKSLEQYQR